MSELNFDELMAKLGEQRNNLLVLAHEHRIEKEEFQIADLAINVLNKTWDNQKAAAFIHKHMCHACLEGPVQTFPQFDYNLCYDCSVIIISEHLTDWCKI